ncbi:xylosidase : arabinofuranosidase [Stagonosporopsis vannaccii]|nr:xylosidase : arabinofuranosidase [Stagonosporopsis vannaccii]
MLALKNVLWTCITLIPLVSCSNRNKTITNPILPGWNSDPSCTFVKEWDNTFFCTTSSFLAFPGVPVYASKDLTNWRLASHALTRPSQLPELSNEGQQMEGIWASTIRYREGTLYLITSYIQWNDWAPKILLFTTKDPFTDDWSDPVVIENPANDIDPDIFWDDDGKIYMAVAAGIWISEINIETGTATEPFRVWNGTGDRNPEGPHLYKKDGYYYLLIGEGGTELNHTATIARSKDIRGPYEGYSGNPFLTNKNTDEYFQTVGHADFFQDAEGEWWAVALATRSGPEWEVYPMGRESVLVPMKWEKGEWPVIDQVRGKQSGPLPPTNKRVKGNGPFADEGDKLDFGVGSSFPKQLLFWRPPKTSLFAISPPGHPNTLRISPSRVNLTADTVYNPAVDGLGFIARKQTATTFDYSVDLSFQPTQAEEEAGVTVFLTQMQHIDLSIINVDSKGSLIPHLRWRVEAIGKPDYTAPEARTVPLSKTWRNQPIRLSIEATDDSEYVFSAASVSKPREAVSMGTASAQVVSGGSGPFTGTIIGAFATSNNGTGNTPAYFSRWRYTPKKQAIAANIFIPA